jgi:hypothetical protein
VRRHQLSIRDGLWVALLGPSVEKGIVVIGPSVESALRVFDTQYLSFPKASTAATKIHNSTKRGSRVLRNERSTIDKCSC